MTPWTVAHQVPLSMDFSGKNTGVNSHALLQGIFPIQGLNSGLPYCRQIFYHLSIRPDTMELLGENIGRTLFDVNHSKIIFDSPPRVMEIKTNKQTKINGPN